MPSGDGHPFIVYDGTALNFPTGPAFFQKRPVSLRSLLISHGKMHSVSLRHLYDLGRLLVENFDDAEIERQLHAWWSWAVRGNVYQVAFADPDSAGGDDAVVEIPLSAGVGPGGTVFFVPIPQGNDVKREERYDVKEATGHEFERFEVDTVLVRDRINMKPGTTHKYGYAVGDKITHRGFFPKAVSLDDAQPWGPVGATGFTFDHRFREVA